MQLLKVEFAVMIWLDWTGLGRKW